MNSYAAIGLALVLGAPVTKEAPKKAETPSIVGEWVCVEAIFWGQTFTGEQLAEARVSLELTADGKARHRQGRGSSEDSYTVDTTKDPAEINIVADKTKKTTLGIFKIEKDILTICRSGTEGVRPTKFEAPDGSKNVVLKFARVPKKKD